MRHVVILFIILSCLLIYQSTIVTFKFQTMQPFSQRNSPIERFLTANHKAASVLVLFFVILISACQKKMDVINDLSPLSQKRIEVAEIKQWVDKMLPTLIDQPTLLYARAEQSTINGNHFVRIPTKGKGSDKGSFYFKRRPDGSMEVNYVVQLVSDSIKGNGIVGFANLDEKTFRVNVYENNKLVLSKIVPDSLGLFNKAFLSSASLIKKLSGCPEQVTRITLPDGSDSVIIVKTLGDPRIDCPRDHDYVSFWDRVQIFFGNIGTWFRNNFGGGGGGGNSGGGDPWGLWFFAWNGANIGGSGNGNGHSGSGGSGDFSGGGGGGGGQNGSGNNPWGPFQFPSFNVTGNNASNPVEYLLIALNNLSASEADWLSNNSEVAEDLYAALSEGTNTAEELLATQITVTTFANNSRVFDKAYFELIKDHLQGASNSGQLNPDPILNHLILQCALIKIEHPEYSDIRLVWEAWRELLQLGLDVVGLVPVLGEIADVINGLIYSLYGEGINAGLSFAAAIPVGGWFATGTKYAKKTITTLAGTKTTLKWIVQTDGFINFGLRGQLRTVLGLAVGNSKQAHHIIPWEFWKNDIIQKAAKSKKEFHMNDFLNGIPLEKSIHIEGMAHPAYNNRVLEELGKINQRYNFNISPEDAGKEIEILISRIRKAIIENPGVSLNQIIF